jgi:hypothetical protein
MTAGLKPAWRRRSHGHVAEKHHECLQRLRHTQINGVDMRDGHASLRDNGLLSFVCDAF